MTLAMGDLVYAEILSPTEEGVVGRALTESMVNGDQIIDDDIFVCVDCLAAVLNNAMAKNYDP